MNIQVSIIVPCYNQAQFLSDALHSVLGQTYNNWECIIVNDGSTDYTETIAKDWCKKDNRFKYLCKENGGLSSARNAGLNIAKGNFIQFLDSDDILCSQKLEFAISELDDTSDKNVIISNFMMFSGVIDNFTLPYCILKKELFNFDSILFKWDYEFSIPIHCGLFQAELFQNFKFNEKLKAKEDWLMWITIFQQNIHVIFIDKPLVYYRKHSNSMTVQPKFMQENHLKAILELESLLPAATYIKYLKFALQDKFRGIAVLETSINNYQNTTSYKIIESSKKSVVMITLLKVFKKFIKN